MSDLSTGEGGLPPGWGYPSPIIVNGKSQSGGMVWLDRKAATQADFDAIEEAQPDADLDAGTFDGLYSWKWLPFSDKVAFLQGNPPVSRMGGLGSQNYENQHVGESDGALFRKESDGEMWYTNAYGDLVYGIPEANAGCYHNKYVGDGYYDVVEGVEQGSAADKILGRGEFYWDEKRRLYDVR